MARRVVLIEIDAQAQGAKTYAAWNAADKTANCTLSGGNLTATAAATANYNAARATIGISAGQHYWETTHNFAAGTVTLAGICTAAFAMATTGIGTDAGGLSASGPRTDGNCYFKNVVAGDAGTVANGTLVRHHLDMDSGTYRVAIGAGSFVTVATGLTGTWFAVAQFQTNAHAVVANFGATAFTYAAPVDALSGVYTTGAATSSVQRVATESVFTASDGVPASVMYKPRLLLGDITMKRKAGAWPITNSGTEFALGEIQLANDDGFFDSWRDLIVRDRAITIRYGTPTQAQRPQTTTLWLSAVCDRIEYREKVLIIKLTDLRSRLNKPLQTATYIGPQVATLKDRVKPATLGKANNIDPVLIDAANRIYDCHDSNNMMVLEVTDQADPDVLSTDFRQDANGFVTTVAHIGRTAATVSGQVTPGADLLGADGNFGTWVAGAFTTNPQGWTVTGETSATVGVHESPAGNAQIRNTGGGGQVTLGKSAFTAGTGVSYFVDMSVSGFTSGSLRIWSSTAANVTTTQRIAGISVTGAHRFVITPAASETFLVIGTVSGANTDMSIDNVRVYPITQLELLPDFMTQLCVTRGGLVSGDLDSTAINALNTKAPYVMGFHAREAVMIDQIIRDLMDCFCGWMVPTYDGKLTVGRLEEPASTATLSLTRYDLTGRPLCTLDTAKGLTDRLGAVRNWSLHSDSDIATSVSLATRERLKVEYQEVVKALGALSPTYAHALTAAVRGSLLLLRAQALAEISRVATLYRKERYFYEIPCLLDISTANTLAIGATVRVTYPAFDLAAGKNLLVLGVDSSIRRQKSTLVCWG